MARHRHIFAAVFTLFLFAGMVATVSAGNLELGYPGNPPVRPDSTGNGYLFYCSSWVDLPDMVFPFYSYTFQIENYSRNFGIASWKLQDGQDVLSFGSDVSVGSLPIGPAPVDVNDVDTVWSAVDTTATDTPEQRMSIITFSDLHTENVLIYVPKSVVPEPSSILALISGMGSLVMLRRRS